MYISSISCFDYFARNAFIKLTLFYATVLLIGHVASLDNIGIVAAKRSGVTANFCNVVVTIYMYDQQEERHKILLFVFTMTN